MRSDHWMQRARGLALGGALAVGCLAVSTGAVASTLPVPDIPPTPNQAAIDSYVDAFALTGAFDFGASPQSYPPENPNATSTSASALSTVRSGVHVVAAGLVASGGGGGSTPGGMSAADAATILESVYQHRLSGPDDTIQNLISRDPEVAQAYSTLQASGQLTTGGADTTAVLQHLSLVRNQGTTGGFVLEGNQVTSTGILVPPLACLVNPGGFVDGLPFQSCNGNNQAIVYLTVRTAGGSVYRYFTTTSACGGRAVYGFRRVVNGSADLIARPIRACCQSVETTFQITCPPGPAILMPCLPPGTNKLVNVTMGPGQPPGFFGQVTGPGAGGAAVWVGNRDDACLVASSTSADANGNFTLPGCLPSGDVFVYASGGGRIGRVDVADVLQCGQFQGPLSIPLLPLPTVSGHIRSWSPSWFPNAGALAQGCTAYSCNAAASQTVLAPGAQLDGTYTLQLKPGRWDLFSYRDFGSCVNSSGHTVTWRCLLYHGVINLEAGQTLAPVDLDPVLSTCTCPN